MTPAIKRVGRHRLSLVIERFARWFVASAEADAPLGPYEVEGPFETLLEAQAHVANDNGRER